jgi:hypothetical protein
VFLVIALQQIRCVDIIYWLQGVIAFRVSSPFDEILQGMTVPKVPMVLDGFNFILSFSFDKVQWWPGEVRPMLCHFVIG